MKPLKKQMVCQNTLSSYMYVFQRKRFDCLLVISPVYYYLVYNFVSTDLSCFANISEHFENTCVVKKTDFSVANRVDDLLQKVLACKHTAMPLLQHCWGCYGCGQRRLSRADCGVVVVTLTQ